MFKYTAIFSFLIILVACSNGISKNTIEQGEDVSSKALLQGIWVDDDTEIPLMRIVGDTIYYADLQSAPVQFKIIRDTLYTYGNDTAYYKIDELAAHTFWFHALSDNIIKLHKSEDLNDSLSFNGERIETTLAYTEVIERDSVVTFNGTRYRAYVYINPSKQKIIKTSYSDEGISIENVYYDNIMHICVYEGKSCLYSSDITKLMLQEVAPQDFLEQSILSDMQFMKVDNKGFHYQAVLGIPESQVYSLANLTIDFDGKLAIEARQ